MKRYAKIVILILLTPTTVLGHGLRYHMSRGDSITVVVTYHDDTPFAGRKYEIFRPGETEPCFSGRTGRGGQIVFRPDSSGSWRIRSFSEDGHGLDISFEAEGLDSPVSPVASGSRRTTHLLLGVAIILGLFNLYLYILKRRQSRPST
jgi:nickel transport protein